MLRKLGHREAVQLQNSFNQTQNQVPRATKKVVFVQPDSSDSTWTNGEVKPKKSGMPDRAIPRSPESGFDEGDDGEIYNEERVQSTGWIQKRYVDGKWSAKGSKIPWDMFVLNHGHDAINERLDIMDIGQICRCESRKRKHSILSTIMDLATNWERLVYRQLDRFVSTNPEAEDMNDPRFFITLDFHPVFGHKSSIIKEILFHGHKKAQTVLSHPLMETYLTIRNEKLSKWFTASFALYLVFLFSYTGHQVSIFYLRKAEQTEVLTFPSCFTNGHSWECVFGLICAFSFSFLLLEESFQLYVFRRRYFKRFDTWLRMVIFILVIVGFFFQRNLAVLRFLAAIGVPCAWIHLVFLSGFHGATISIMFIHIMHKRFLGGILLTLTVATGCAAGFLIIAHNTASGVVDSRTLVKILFRPLLMILGEYEFIDTYETFEDDLPTLIYSTVLLLCIAIVGSLVLVNLLLALILSDIMDLYNICHSKNLFRQARQVVFYEKLAKTFGVKMVVPDRVRICAHKSCKCEHLKLRKSATAQIMKIVQQQKERTGRPQTAAKVVFEIDDLF